MQSSQRVSPGSCYHRTICRVVVRGPCGDTARLWSGRALRFPEPAAIFWSLYLGFSHIPNLKPPTASTFPYKNLTRPLKIFFLTPPTPTVNLSWGLWTPRGSLLTAPIS